MDLECTPEVYEVLGLVVILSEAAEVCDSTRSVFVSQKRWCLTSYAKIAQSMDG